ncbi:hypothetical protein CSKR_103778, partial [Clonorchis sinensis]
MTVYRSDTTNDHTGPPASSSTSLRSHIPLVRLGSNSTKVMARWLCVNYGPYPPPPSVVAEKSSSACKHEAAKHGAVGDGRKGSTGSEKVWEAYLDRNVEFRSSTGSDLSSQYGSIFTPKQEITKDYLKLQSRVGELEVETAVLKVKVDRQLSRISEGTPTEATYSLFGEFPSAGCDELIRLKQQVKKLIKKTAEVKVNLDRQVSREQEDPDASESEEQ